MAQNEPQGMEAAAGQTGTGSTGSKSSTPQTGTAQAGSTAQGVPVTRREQQEQQGGRLTRREGWDDPFTGFFGGSPFALFRRLSDDMDRMFFGGGQGLGPVSTPGMRFIPNVDVEERDDRILVRADLPGVKLDDLEVQIEEDAVVLQGERRYDREDTRGGLRRFERTYGNFRRVIPLPPGANTDAAEARFDNGVLQIEIPVQKESKSRRLEVRSAGSTGTGSEKTSDSTKH